MPAFIDLTGREFGRFTVLRRTENNRHNQPQWLCRCSCGVEKVIRGSGLTSGQSRSCGCLNSDVRRRICIERNTTHGRSKSRTYTIWVNMVQRCTNPQNPGYKKYGARGVTVADRWLAFDNFLADMGECPGKLTLDRINNAKGYEPRNCRWTTQKVQQQNRTNNRLLTFANETLPITEWARRAGIHRHIISQRLRKGWTPERALTYRAPTDGRFLPGHRPWNAPEKR